MLFKRTLFMLGALILAGISFGLYYYFTPAQTIDEIAQNIDAQTIEIIPDRAAQPSTARTSQTGEHTAALGFCSLNAEHHNVPLTIKGNIPTWVNGMLLRTGPALFETKSNTASHWFDGCGMVHKFNIENGKVNYSNKFIASNYHDQVKKTGKFGMSKEKKTSFFGRIGALMAGDAPKYDNGNSHIWCIGGCYCAMTETPYHKAINHDTLASAQGFFQFEDKLEGHYACPHPHIDEETGDMYNYLIQYGNTSTYVVYKIPAGSKERIPLAKINVGYPSYMHSFAMTDNYIVLTEIPFRINPLDLVLTDKTFFEAFTWKPKQGTKYTVIDKHTGAIVGTYTGDAFFALHHINAYEEDHTLVLDIATYNDPSIIYSFVLDTMRDQNKYKLHRAQPMRITLDLDKKSKDAVTMHKLSNHSFELPRINYDYNGKPYTYVYGTHARKEDNLTTTIIKLNVANDKELKWREEGCYPGEPIFIAKPGSTEEDDGIVLATVLDARKGTSFLVALDAATMKEVGRAELDHHIPFDSHGNFYARA